jgi:hypothetical protein
MAIDLSKFSPALLEAAALRTQELGYESLERYFEALVQDDSLSPIDPTIHVFLSKMGDDNAFDEELLRFTKGRLGGESSEP